MDKTIEISEIGSEMRGVHALCVSSLSGAIEIGDGGTDSFWPALSRSFHRHSRRALKDAWNSWDKRNRSRIDGDASPFGYSTLSDVGGGGGGKLGKFKYHLDWMGLERQQCCRSPTSWWWR